MNQLWDKKESFWLKKVQITFLECNSVASMHYRTEINLQTTEVISLINKKRSGPKELSEAKRKHRTRGKGSNEGCSFTHCQLNNSLT